MPKTESKPEPAIDDIPPATDVLARKWRRTRVHKFPVADPTDAAERLEQAQRAVRTAVALHPPGEDGQDSPEVVEAQAARDQAQKDLDACFGSITFQAISSRAWQKLLAEHPPTAEQRAAGNEWNPDTFHPALIAAAAKDVELTPEQWAERLDDDAWSVGDRNALFGVALAVNLAG